MTLLVTVSCTCDFAGFDSTDTVFASFHIYCGALLEHETLLVEFVKTVPLTVQVCSAKFQAVVLRFSVFFVAQDSLKSTSFSPGLSSCKMILLTSHMPGMLHWIGTYGEHST